MDVHRLMINKNHITDAIKWSKDPVNNSLSQNDVGICGNCIIARALFDEGWKDISVGFNIASASKGNIEYVLRFLDKDAVHEYTMSSLGWESSVPATLEYFVEEA